MYKRILLHLPSPKFWKWPKKYLVLILIILIGGGYYFYSHRNKAVVYTYAQVKREDIQKTISASGIINGKNSANMHFNLPGKLAQINFKVGDKVKKGDPIAFLDTTDLYSELQQSQNTLRDKQTALEKVVDDIHLYQYGNGGESNIGSANETETQKSLRTSAEAARDSATEAVKQAQKNLGDAVLISPLDGTVVTSPFVVGQNVTGADVIAQISDFSGIDFEADIDESDIGNVTLGQKADITLNSYGDKMFYGTVTEITPTTKTTSSGATVVTVKIGLDNTDILPISGLNGQSDLIVEEHKNVLTVPIEALRSDNTVLVQNGKTNNPVKVTPGLQGDTDVEITSGLTEGENVVTNPPSPTK